MKRCGKDSGAIVMSHVSLRLLFALALVLGGLWPSVVMAQSVYGTHYGSRVFHMIVSVSAGDSILVETTSLTSGEDTVLQVWDVTGGFRAAWNDDRSASDLSSELFVMNSTGSARNYVVFMHSGLAPRTVAGTATVRITRTLSGLVSTYNNIGVGGGIVDVRDGSTWTHQTVERAGSTTTGFLATLDSQGRMLDYDDTSGVGSMSLLQGSTSTRYVLVGCGRYSLSPGNLHLISNSTLTDADGDGVGVELELELTSCDSASTFPRCIDVFNRADSDRDGITDYAEIFGVDGASPLRLHRWGARPGVKDIFVEVDWSQWSAANPNGFIDNPFGPVHSTPGQIETFAREVQNYYTESEISNWLGNISTSDRVRIHLDLGVNPPIGSPDVWLYGNWGGSSGCARNTDAGWAFNNCLTPSRKGYFRVALAANAGVG